MVTQYLTNSILIQEFGFDKVIEMLTEKFNNYTNQYLKYKSIYSLQNGILRIEFIVTDENVKEKIKNIEVTLDKNIQQEIYKTYLTDFFDSLLHYFRSEVEKVKEKLSVQNPNFEYKIFTSNVSIFTYLKNSGVLRLEIIL